MPDDDPQVTRATLDYEDGTTRVFHLDDDPSGIVLAIGRDRELTHVQEYSTGTVVLTIRRREA